MRFQAGPASLWETAVFDLKSGLIAGGSILGGLFGAKASTDAADTQAQAANNAAMLQYQQQQQNRDDLSPYRQFGQNAGTLLNNKLTDLSQPFNPDQATLEATPGYKWNLSQGLQSVQNAAAAKGLGISGAALKGAANFATGLADNTLQTQYNIDQGNKTNAFNKLLETMKVGANAANQTAQSGTQTAQNAGQYSTSAGAANAAGTVGAANALTGGVNSAVNNYMNYNLLNKLTSGGGQVDPATGVRWS